MAYERPAGSGGNRMKQNIIAAVIIAIGLIAAGFLYGGRYYFIRLDECTVARGDRFTGEVSNAGPITEECWLKSRI